MLAPQQAVANCSVSPWITRLSPGWVATLLLAVSLVLAPAASGAEYQATGLYAKDGDSIVARFPSGLEVEIRLLSMDTPEHGQRFADEAKQFTHSRIAGKALRITTGSEERDHYNRLLAWVEVDGREVNLDLLTAGLAVAYVRPPNTDQIDEVLAAQASAYEARRGVWEAEGSMEEPGSARARKRKSSNPMVPLKYEHHIITGNRRSMVAHWPGCAHTLEMSPGNRLFYETVAEAQRLGFRMEKGFR